MSEENKLSFNLKNCESCTGLNYHDGNEFEGEGPNGFFCANRIYKNEADERKHLRKINNKNYRLRYKKCWDDRMQVRMPYE